jgi:hypothetical protein
MATTWSSDHSAIYRNLHLRLAIANDLSLATGFTRIDRKVTLMQLRHQFNSYSLMHIQESNTRYKDKQNSRKVVRCTRACLALARGSFPRLVLAPVAPRVLAPWGLTQKCKYETLNITCNAWGSKCNMLHDHAYFTYFDT